MKVNSRLSSQLLGVQVVREFAPSCKLKQSSHALHSKNASQ